MLSSRQVKDRGLSEGWRSLGRTGYGETGRDESSNGYTHLALSVAPEDFDILVVRIKASGTRIWQGNLTEGDSLYFTDPDGDKLEIRASDLGSRLRSKRS